METRRIVEGESGSFRGGPHRFGGEGGELLRFSLYKAGILGLPSVKSGNLRSEARAKACHALQLRICPRRGSVAISRYRESIAAKPESANGTAKIALARRTVRRTRLANILIFCCTPKHGDAAWEVASSDPQCAQSRRPTARRLLASMKCFWLRHTSKNPTMPSARRRCCRSCRGGHGRRRGDADAGVGAGRRG